VERRDQPVGGRALRLLAPRLRDAGGEGPWRRASRHAGAVWARRAGPWLTPPRSRPVARRRRTRAPWRLRVLLARRSTPRGTSIARPSAATWKASFVAHLVESSRIREPSGYSHISVTSRRPRSPVDFSFSWKIGPCTDRSSRVTPSGACSAKKARCALENSLRTGRSPLTAALTASGATSPCGDAHLSATPSARRRAVGNSGTVPSRRSPPPGRTNGPPRHTVRAAVPLAGSRSPNWRAAVSQARQDGAAGLSGRSVRVAGGLRIWVGCRAGPGRAAYGGRRPCGILGRLRWGWTCTSRRCGWRRGGGAGGHAALPITPRGRESLGSGRRRGSATRRGRRALGCTVALSRPVLAARSSRRAWFRRGPGDRVKTDTRDARRLAALHAGGLLTAISVPSPEAEALGDLVRCREDARLDRMRARHRLGKVRPAP
jgi:hypothetical protein